MSFSVSFAMFLGPPGGGRRRAGQHTKDRAGDFTGGGGGFPLFARFAGRRGAGEPEPGSRSRGAGVGERAEGGGRGGAGAGEREQAGGAARPRGLRRRPPLRALAPRSTPSPRS